MRSAATKYAGPKALANTGRIDTCPLLDLLLPHHHHLLSFLLLVPSSSLALARAALSAPLDQAASHKGITPAHLMQ